MSDDTDDAGAKNRARSNAAVPHFSACGRTRRPGLFTGSAGLMLLSVA